MEREKYSLSDAEAALRENLGLLDPAKYKAARNTNIALLGIAQELRRLLNDVELLHRKLQPILKYLEEDNPDSRLRWTRTEYDP